VKIATRPIAPPPRKSFFGVGRPARLSEEHRRLVVNQLHAAKAGLNAEVHHARTHHVHE
jgi:hypothetical protein